MKPSRLAVVIPCYKTSGKVMDVISGIPVDIWRIYCVDDKCPEETGKHIQENSMDERVHVLFHDKNQGVGGAMITGYKQALKDGAQIIVKLDSDGQMDPALIPAFIEPIIQGRADYTKGNRFFTPEYLSAMPKIRLIGNAGLSFLTKFSSGYWQIFDPTNGYTAIHADVLKLLPLDKISKDYFFESDMLFRLGTLRAVVLDVPQRAIYEDEKSNLSIAKSLWSFFYCHTRNFYKRIVYNYFIRDFHVASIEWILGPALLIFSFIFGISAWSSSVYQGVSASAGTVMLAALPFIAGLQLLLSAIQFDIQNQPRMPLHILTKGMK